MKNELKYYNENNYILKRNNGPSFSEKKELQELMLNYQKRNNVKNEMNYQKYNYILKDYSLFVKLTQKFIQELNLCNNPINYSFLFYYLLNNGYFSINDFKIDASVPQFELPINYAINVILGKGCCRHISSLYNDVMNPFFDTNLFYCIESLLKNKTYIHHKKANHVINLLTYNNLLLGYDSMNNKFYHFINKEQMSIISYNISSYLTYKPYYDIIYNNKSFDDIISNYELFNKHTNDNVSFLYDIKYMQNNIEYDINEKQSLVDDYELETLPIKEKIKEKMLRIK